MEIVSLQVYRDVWSTPVTKPYMAHRVRGTVWGLHFCPFEDVLGIGYGEGFTSMLVPGQTWFYITAGHVRGTLNYSVQVKVLIATFTGVGFHVSFNPGIDSSVD